jgi:ADP-glucose pyrophosphorylase
MYQHPAAHMSIVDSESLGIFLLEYKLILEYDDEEIQKSVEDFYEDLVPELQKFGEIEVFTVEK